MVISAPMTVDLPPNCPSTWTWPIQALDTRSSTRGAAGRRSKGSLVHRPLLPADIPAREQLPPPYRPGGSSCSLSRSGSRIIGLLGEVVPDETQPVTCDAPDVSRSRTSIQGRIRRSPGSQSMRSAPRVKWRSSRVDPLLHDHSPTTSGRAPRSFSSILL